MAALRAVVAANAGAAKGGRAAALRDDRRIRLSCVPPEGQKRGAVLQANKALEDFGLKDGDTVLVKVRDRVIAARRRAIGPRVPSAPRRGRPIARRLPPSLVCPGRGLSCSVISPNGVQKYYI